MNIILTLLIACLLAFVVIVYYKVRSMEDSIDSFHIWVQDLTGCVRNIERDINLKNMGLTETNPFIYDYTFWNRYSATRKEEEPSQKERSGIQRIKDKRKELLELLNGFDTSKGQLGTASRFLNIEDSTFIGSLHAPCGWDYKFWKEKFVEKPYKQRLAISAALAAMEIDRLNQLDEWA